MNEKINSLNEKIFWGEFYTLSKSCAHSQLQRYKTSKFLLKIVEKFPGILNARLVTFLPPRSNSKETAIMLL